MDVCTKQQRLAELARQSPQMAFTPLNHYLDMDWLREAHRRTRKDSAPGVDGETAGQFALELDARLADLLERAKSGRYVAPPVKRAHLPKGPGQTRPIGMPTFENKVLERAVVMVLEPIYEQDFLDCSYGFRPGRSCHQALEALWRAIMSMGGCWLIDADIAKFLEPSTYYTPADERLSKRDG
jgi:RNA-directed DNA polymerase